MEEALGTLAPRFLLASAMLAACSSPVASGETDAASSSGQAETDSTVPGTTDLPDASSSGGDDSTGLPETTLGDDSGGPNPFCGDGTVQPPESCDDAGESARCDSDCSLAGCGDGDINRTAEEDCEGDDLRGMTCADLGFEERGTLACARDCRFDLTGCGPAPFEIDYAQVKRFVFSWSEVDGARSYRILERVSPDGEAEQLGPDTSELSATFEMPLHLRREASYTLQACFGDPDCADVATVAVDEDMTAAVGLLEDVEAPSTMGR